MNKHKGFTIVEIVVVITVIGILATLATLGFSKYLADGRDSQRSARVTVIADYLERYYDTNGEYPGCDAITASGGTVASNTLKGIDQVSLLVPDASSGTTNSIRCDETLLSVSGDDFYEYQGDGSGGCTGSGACTEFTLRYREEASSSVKTISSRRN